MSQMNQETSQALWRQKDYLAGEILSRLYQRRPEMMQRHGESGQRKWLRGVRNQMECLAQAIALSQLELFTDYVAWADAMLQARRVPGGDLAAKLETLVEVAKEHLSAEGGAAVASYVSEALSRLTRTDRAVASAMRPEDPLHDLARHYLEALLQGRRHMAGQLVLDAVERGTSIQDIYLHVFQKTQHEVGRRWQMNEVSVAEEHYCTASTQQIMSQLYPRIFATPRKLPVLVLTGMAVAGELHELGIRMVADFFEMNGWNTYYTGANTPAEDLINSIISLKPRILGISASMTPHLAAVMELIAAVRGSEAGKEIKIMVGGHPFNRVPGLWRQVGADGWAADAGQAIAVAAQLLNGAGVSDSSR